MAAAEVPTRTAVGVASPSAQGQATTRTLQASCRLRSSLALRAGAAEDAAALPEAAMAVPSLAAARPRGKLKRARRIRRVFGGGNGEGSCGLTREDLRENLGADGCPEDEGRQRGSHDAVGEGARYLIRKALHRGRASLGLFDEPYLRRFGLAFVTSRIRDIARE